MVTSQAAVDHSTIFTMPGLPAAAPVSFAWITTPYGESTENRRSAPSSTVASRPTGDRPPYVAGAWCSTSPKPASKAAFQRAVATGRASGP